MHLTLPWTFAGRFGRHVRWVFLAAPQFSASCPELPPLERLEGSV